MGKRVNLAELATDDLEAAGPPSYPVSVVPEPVVNEPPSAEGVRLVPIGTVTTNPLNKRPTGKDDELAEMAETIRVHGVIQPLVVCSSSRYLDEFPDQGEAVGDARWVVLIGNRRLRAARMAPLDQVGILVNDDQVTSMYEVMLVENGQRKDLPPLLEAEAMSEVLRTSSISKRELGRRIGKSHMYVVQRLALLKLIPELRQALEHGELTIERAREIGELPVVEQRKIFAAGKPYRRIKADEPEKKPARSIRVSTPRAAADAIRRTFTADELAELIRLLSTPDL
ncbi:hypothetical protein GCM10023321_80260 [Pseudonocardia eucalypti]|uniref:ParB-like N-terminal domain-containing protein n=1 Tax=Pseudonocardia eucalypti TaxID=648755 RepID=A0ABP9RCD9_9PSEU|nr:ParB family chromosome partitioning protein [Pseudonocardia eucalypti]